MVFLINHFVSRQIGGFFSGKIMALSKLELDWKSSIPHPSHDLDLESFVFYSLYYGFNGVDRKNRLWDNKEDSPDESRASLIKKVHPHISSLPEGSFVLDLGAGRQIFEKEYEDRYGRPKCNIVTVDIASIRKCRLLAQNYPHLQASGRSLPFPNEIFDIVISNMAFDFMLPQALPELYQIVKPGGAAFLNLHHPSLVNYDIDREKHKLMRSLRGKKTIPVQKALQLAVYSHHKYLRDNRLLFETPDQIVEAFGTAGFEVKQVRIKSDTDNFNKWWEVDMVKNV